MGETQKSMGERGRGLNAFVNGPASATRDSADNHELIDATGACRLLGVHRNTLYRLIQSGDIPALKFTPGGRWRFRKDDLLDWLEARRAGRLG